MISIMLRVSYTWCILYLVRHHRILLVYISLQRMARCDYVMIVRTHACTPAAPESSWRRGGRGTTVAIEKIVAHFSFVPFNPFSTAVPFWGQTSQISGSLSPKRDCGSKGVNQPHVRQYHPPAHRHFSAASGYARLHVAQHSYHTATYVLTTSNQQRNRGSTQQSVVSALSALSCKKTEFLVHRTAIPCWRQTAQTPSGLSPKMDCGAINNTVLSITVSKGFYEMHISLLLLMYLLRSLLVF